MVIVSQYYAERSLKLHCCVRSVAYVTCMDIGWCMMSYVHCYLCDTSLVAVCPPPDAVWYVFPPPDAVWYVIPLPTLCDTSSPLPTLCDTSSPPDAVWYVIPPPDAVWYVIPSRRCVIRHPLPTLCDTSSPSRRCVIRHPPPDAVWYVIPPPDAVWYVTPSRRCVIRQSCHCVWHPLTLCDTSIWSLCVTSSDIVCDVIGH